MTRTILITGATDGIGLLTAQTLAAEGHIVLLHGRSAEKLDLAAHQTGGRTQIYRADLSRMDQVHALARAVLSRHDRLDVLINNAGVFKTSRPRTVGGMDTRFMVNTVAPFLLTRLLLPIIPPRGRVVNLSSAAQAPVDVSALRGEKAIDDMAAYAQSKLAITIWTQAMAQRFPGGPAFVAVNPGSLLATKMVKAGFGISGNDPAVGAETLCRAALSSEFDDASGMYFDRDSGRFARPHDWSDDPRNVAAVLAAIEDTIATAASAEQDPRVT